MYIPEHLRWYYYVSIPEFPKLTLWHGECVYDFLFQKGEADEYFGRINVPHPWVPDELCYRESHFKTCPYCGESLGE